ncbi:MAG: hypothetical protein EXQ85_07925 [Alphaproteobacteria bacterium]|nr:hypothetical protein [Alphaproteobacteria bacterium]
MTRRDVGAALFGAYRLARFDAAGIRYFDLSLDGFWQSFAAALLCLPLHGYVRIASRPPGDDAIAYYVVQLIGYGVGWVAWPLLMIALARTLILGRGYVPYIIATNWSSVWITLVLAPSQFLFLSAGTRGVAAVLYLLSLGFVFSYQWFVARAALGATKPTTVLIVGCQFLLDFVIALATDRLAQSLG